MNLKKTSSLRSEKIKSSNYIGIFLIALSTLLLEFSLTRVLSVSLWYHFAFMVISVALLGFGVSGVVLSLSKKLNTINTDKILAILSMCYGTSVILSFIIMNKIPFDPFSLLTDSIQFVYLPVYYILITIPFFFAGLVISILLSRFKSEISKLYFFDLIGAGLACIAFVLIIPVVGGNGAVVFVAVIAFLAAIVFSFENYKSLSLASFVLLIIAFTFLINHDERFPINVTANKIYGNYMKDRPDLKVHSEWNTFSKVDVMIDEDKAADGYNLYLAIIDAGNATTNIPNVKSLSPLTKPSDASNLAFALKDSADKVFIIGSAGGGEILAGLYHNAKNINAVEINGILNNLIKNDLAYWTGPLIKGNKRVNLITDDARSVLSSRRIAYDVIISAHTISASAVSSGAMSMVENYILTKEAVKEYLNHLDKEGVLYISRPETQIPKIITTLKEARFENSKGLENSKTNFIIFRRPPSDFESEKSFLAGVLYKKNGFSFADVMKIREEAGMLNMEILYDPLTTQDSEYKRLIESDNIYEEVNKNSRLEPATDDKPFFDQNIGFSNLSLQGIKETFSQDDKAILALTDKPVAETTLLAILIQCIVIAGILILLPLKFFKKENSSDKTLTEFSIDKKYLFYFACLGLGYIVLQICMIQKFTLFLGQPVITLLTVVSTMLLASGVGSLVSLKFYKNNLKKLYLIFGIIVILTLTIGILNPYIFNSLVRLELHWRVIISALIIFPLGFFMGMPFPIGMSMILPAEKRFVAFAWAVNGFFSVIGTVSAIILAMMFGFRIVFIIGAVIYLFALILLIGRHKKLVSLIN
ncbi:MAG: hypothetical protein M3R36_17385 [Bacteroidota bacterium]|nr:hypothetical protein [Bacteroidota bacterium]